MAYKNIEDKKAYNKKWSAEHRERRREYRKRWNRQRRVEVGGWYRELKKNLQCSRCPETFFACMEFHHIGKKKDNIPSMVSHGCTIEKIKKEMEKCIVLCSNCHRKEHHKLGLLV